MSSDFSGEEVVAAPVPPAPHAQDADVAGKHFPTNDLGRGFAAPQRRIFGPCLNTGPWLRASSVRLNPAHSGRG